MKRNLIPALAFMALFLSCQPAEKNTNLLQQALASPDPAIQRVMDSLDLYEVQIKYTRIDRANDSLILKDHTFQVDDDHYFYPASTVKFPIAVLALERLNQTDTLSMNTRYYVEGDTIESTVLKDVSEVFAVSDNLANNRLLELLGQDAVNQALAKKGIGPVRISHRLGYHSDDLRTKPWIVYLNDSTTSPSLPTTNTAPMPLQINALKKGTGYYEGDSLMAQPFDFSLKNYYPINAQHDVLKRVIFPEKFPEEERFQLSPDQRKELLKAMHTVPRKAGYDADTYYDGYCKFFIYGDTKDNIPEHMKIYNKVGFAYGTLTDCAYIVDEKNNVEFMLTATLLVNKDGVFNDDAYEYDEVGIPFLAALGRTLYALELERK